MHYEHFALLFSPRIWQQTERPSARATVATEAIESPWLAESLAQADPCMAHAVDPEHCGPSH